MLVLAAMVTAVLVLVPAAPAAAHATLVGTDPSEGQVLTESPGKARLTFDETVSAVSGGVQVFDARGEAVPSEATARDTVLTVDLPEQLRDGTYVVSWRVVSADGHPVTGALTFSVGQPSAVVKKPPSQQASGGGVVRGVLSVAEGVGYVGLFIAIGLVLFLGWLLPEVTGLDLVRQRLRRFSALAGAVAAVTALLTLPLAGAYQQGLEIGRVLEGAGWSSAGGRELLSRVLLLTGLVLAVGSLYADRGWTGSRRGVAALGAALAVVSPAVVGHSRAITPQWLVVAADVLHVAAGAVWLGCLLGLALSLRALSRRGRAAADTLTRFSSVAAGILVALVAAGSLMGWRIVGSWEHLFGTTYGRLLIIKVGIAAIAVGVASFNRFVLLPRVERARDNADRQGAATAIARAVAGEASILVAVLLFTGFLVNQSPRQAPQVIDANRTGVEVGRLGEDVRVLGTVSPGGRGANTVTIQLQDLTGEPYEPLRPPTVRVRSDSLDLGDLSLTSSDAGTFRGEVVIPIDGTYRVQVSLRLDKFANPVASLSFEVPVPGR